MIHLNINVNCIIVCFLTHLMCCVDSSIINNDIDRTAKRLTLNFYVNLQNRYVLNKVSNSDITSIQDKVNKFRESTLRRLRDVKDHYNYHYTTYGTNLHQLAEADVYRFERFEQVGMLKTQRLRDISIFSHNIVEGELNQIHLYAAIILDDYQSDGNTLAIYQFLPKMNTWNLLKTENIPRSYKVRALGVPDGTLLVIAISDLKAPDNICNGMVVFQLNDNNKLFNVQSLKTSFFTEIALWKSQLNIYLMAAIDHENQGTKIIYESKNPIYCWKGKHFDLLQNIPSKNARKIMPFQIGSSDFIGIAFHNDNYGEEKIYSEIYKFEVQQQEFVPFQKLATKAAIDIAFFGFKSSTSIEAFIIIVNEYRGKIEADTYFISIIYKYENGIFMPFQNLPANDVKRWLPFIIKNSYNTLKGKYGEFLLIGISKYNEIRLFQYNGWLFVEVEFRFSSSSAVENKIINSFMFYDDPIMAITYSVEGESKCYFYMPIFRLTQPLKEIKSHVYNWCKDVQETLTCLDYKYFKSNEALTDMKKRLDDYYTKIKIDYKKNNTIYLQNAVINTIETAAIYSNDFVFNKNSIENMNYLMESINSQIKSAKSLNEILYNTVSIEGEIVVDSLHIKNLTLNCDPEKCRFKNIDLATMNGKDFKKFQSEAVYINDGIAKYKEIVINNLIVNNKLNVQKINNKPISAIEKMILNAAENNGVEVKGTVYMQKGFSLSGRLMNIQFNDESILLKTGNQHLKGHFVIPIMKTSILEAVKINDIIVEDFKRSINSENKTTDFAFNLEKLTVDDIFLGRSINDINFNNLNDRLLRLTGNQAVQGKFNIGTFNTKKIVLNNDNSRSNFNEIVKINGGEFVIEQDIHFERMITNSLNITSRLNHIGVINGRLDVLLLNSNEEQRVTGDKLFRNVELMGPINLLGRIDQGILEKKNPITMIEEPLNLIGDFTIIGNVSIENMMSCENLMNEELDFSVKRLQQRGLRLSDSEIDVPFIFLQPIEVRHLVADNLNGINPSSWIMANTPETIEITGKKTFFNDLNINGGCSIQRTINGINITEFDTILRTVGDQEIIAKMFIENLTTPAINCDDVTFGNTSWKSLMFSSDNLEINEAIIHSNALVYDYMHSDSIQINGTINGFNISYIISDSVLKNETDVKLYRHMNFNEFTIENLPDESLIDKLGIPRVDIKTLNYSKYIHIEGDLFLDSLPNVKNVFFTHSISGISSRDFGNNWLLSTGDQVIHGHLTIDSMECMDGIEIENGLINDVNVSQLFNSVIWINEDAKLGDVIYKKPPIIMNELILDGVINDGIRPSDFVLKGEYPYIIKGHKIIKNNLYVDKNIMTPSISGVNLDAYCQVLDFNENYKTSWTITGDLYLEYEPKVNFVGEYAVSDLMNNLWFTDTPFRTKKNYYFDQIIFKNDVTLNGYLNTIDLNKLPYTYLSLTADQELTNSYNFYEIHADFITAPEIIVEGYFQGLKIEDFYLNALRTEGNQVIRVPLKFETISGNVSIEGTVNGKNLAKDMMLIGQPNYVPGRKRYIGDVTINNLYTKYIQGVDIEYWMNNLVRKWNNSNNMVGGIKRIRFANIKNLNILETLNDKPPNFIYKNNYNGIQIFPNKVIFGNNTYFKNIYTKGRINDIDITWMFENLIYKDVKNQVIQSPKTITAMSARNVHIHGPFQGYDFKTLLEELTHGGDYDYYLREFQKVANHSLVLVEQYDKLLFKDLDDTETITTIPGSIEAVTCINIVLLKTNYVAIGVRNVDHSEIYFYKWDETIKNFIFDKDIPPLYIGDNILNLVSMETESKSALYIVTMNINTQKYTNYLYIFEMQQGFVNTQQFLSSTVTTLVPLKKDQLSCVLSMHINEAANLYCLGEQNILQLHQTINISNCAKVKVVELGSITYLIAAKQEGVLILSWIRTDLKLIQTLPISDNIDATIWNEELFIVTEYNKTATIYRYNLKTQRFGETKALQYQKRIKNIDLMRFGNEQLFLSILVEERSNYNQLIFNKYDHITDFKYKFAHYIYTTNVKTVQKLRVYNELFIIIESLNQVVILRSYFLN